MDAGAAPSSRRIAVAIVHIIIDFGSRKVGGTLGATAFEMTGGIDGSDGDGGLLHCAEFIVELVVFKVPRRLEVLDLAALSNQITQAAVGAGTFIVLPATFVVSASLHLIALVIVVHAVWAGHRVLVGIPLVSDAVGARSGNRPDPTP